MKLRSVLSLLALSYCALGGLSGRLQAYGGSVPSGLPGSFLMGMVDDDFVTSCYEYGGSNSEINSVSNWMASVDPGHTGFQFAYRYLQGGFVGSSGGWYQQYPGSGGSIGSFASMVTANGYLPVFIYYQLGQLSGGSSATGHSVTNATDMGEYYQDWCAAMVAIDAWMNANPGKPVLFDVEPDMSGSIQQVGGAPASYSMDVSSAANPGGSSSLTPWFAPTQANTFQGYCWYLLAMKDKYVTGANNANLHIAFHVSGWAMGGGNPAATGGMTPTQLADSASGIASFVSACQPSGGSRFELFFTDPSGYDGGYNSTYDWNLQGTTAMGDQYAEWLNDLSADLGLRSMLWQVPMGNSHMTNVNGHYKDTRPEYFLADSPLNDQGYAHNLCLYYNSGCIGILWGRGDYRCTGAMDYFSPAGQSWAPYVATSADQDCATYSGTGSWVIPAVDDDDAGFLRSHIANNAAWGGVCSAVAPSATPTFTDTTSSTASSTPSFTRTDTRTGTPTRTASSTATSAASPSDSPTPTAMPTDTASRTATPTVTASSTEAASPTPTGSPILTSTPSLTPADGGPSATPSATRTGTATPGPSRTPSGTPSATRIGTGTATFTPSATASQPIASATGTATPSPANTHSATPSPSSSPAAGTPTRSPTSGPAASSTPTVTPLSPVSTATGTSTATATRGVTPQPSPSATAQPLTPAQTPSGSATPTAQPGAPSATPTPATAPETATPGPAATAGPATPDPTPAQGPLQILAVCPFPNPNPLSLRVRLAGSCDSLRIEVFDKALVLETVVQGPGPVAAGWQDIAVPKGLPSGLHYCRVQAVRNGAASPPALAKIYVLR